mgnify:CR=1 FL=1
MLNNDIPVIIETYENNSSRAVEGTGPRKPQQPFFLEPVLIPTAAAVLSEKRQILRLTQQEVADRAKITLRQYQRLESGERNILTSSFGLACRVIEALDMDVSKFYHGDYYLEELKTIEGKRFGDRGKHQFK